MQRVRMTVRRETGAILRVLSLVERRGFRFGAVSIGPLGPDLDTVHLELDGEGRDVRVLTRQLERIVEVETVELIADAEISPAQTAPAAAPNSVHDSSERT